MRSKREVTHRDTVSCSTSGGASARTFFLPFEYRVISHQAPTTTLVSATDITANTQKYRETTVSPGEASHAKRLVEKIDCEVSRVLSEYDILWPWLRAYRYCRYG